MQWELQSNNNLSGISLFRIPWKARWEGRLQRSPPGGTGMFHYDSPWQLISSAQEVVGPFQQPN